MAAKTQARTIAVGGESPTNGAKIQIEMEAPYVIEVGIQGVADLLFHRWNVEAVEQKARAKKGSAAKKFDDLESYVYRDSKGFIGLPGEWMRMAVIATAKYRQDPRSSRKSAQDLFKAAIVNLTPVATTGLKTWDYEDRRRVCIQRASITRVRPALKAGWTCAFQLMCNLPEYISPEMLNEVIQQAGKLNGLGDFRPTFGRFQVVSFRPIDLD